MSARLNPKWNIEGFELTVSRKGRYENITIKSTDKGATEKRLYNLLASPHRVKLSFRLK